ncbi:MAG: stage II sporulation protein E [Clostridia bacterium]|nr:stage II sporulation protein E [Clostridia bacterium]
MYQRAALHIKNKILSIFKSIRINEIIMLITGFLLGGANVFEGIAVFGVASSISYMKKGFKAFCLAFPVLGYLISYQGIFKTKYIISCVCLCVLREILHKLKKDKIFEISALCVYPIVALTQMFISGFSIYDTFVLAIECGILYYFVSFYDSFLNYFSSKMLRRTMKQSELLAIILVAVVCMTAGGSIELPLGVNPVGVISVFIIMFCALEFSLGVTAISGIVLGLAVSVTNENMIFCIGSYSVSALLGGLAKKYGKAGIVFTFIITNALVTFYVNGSNEVLINLFDILTASAVFAVFPKAIFCTVRDNLMLLMASEKTREARRLQMIKEFTYRKMSKLSSAFSGLAESLNLCGSKKLKPREETKMLAHNVAERVCKRCKNLGHCWGKNSAETFDALVSLLAAIERRGWAESYDLPSSFKNMCYSYQALVLETNKVYELYRVNMVWENKLSENKAIISQQLESMSEIVKDLAVELKDSFSFETALEKDIIMILDELGIKIKEVAVIPDKNNHYRVMVTVKDCDGKYLCERIMLTAIEKIVGRKMKVSHSACKDGLCMAEYTEKEKFGISTGISRIRPDNETVSGDSYAVITPGEGKTIIALSDGMGVGQKAAEESKAAIDLLDKLLNAGIDRDAAIKLINSVLILKSYDESFATLDMLVFDMYTGIGEFIKTGGVASYIKRGNNVITVNSGSLPTGIIGTCDASNYKVALKEGDVVVILSDGVTDALRGDSVITDTLKNTDITDMKLLSDLIMSKATEKLIRPRDDMTVISSLIQ